MPGWTAFAVMLRSLSSSFTRFLGWTRHRSRESWRGHWSNFDPYEGLTKIFLKIFDGEAAVMLFFVLSGAVLFRSLMREEDGIGGVAVKFYVRRVFRIYPALFDCLSPVHWLSRPAGAGSHSTILSATRCFMISR